MNNNKIYCGSGKEFGQYGGINISICLSDIPEEYKRIGKNNKAYVTLTLNKRQQVGQYGETHSLEVNTYKKDQQNNAQSQNDTSFDPKPF
jgi:hypothetical protein